MAYVFKIDSKISEALDNLTEWNDALKRSPRMYPVGPGEEPSHIHTLFAEYLNTSDPDTDTIADFARWLKDRIKRRAPASKKPFTPGAPSGETTPEMRARMEKIRRAQAEAVERHAAEQEEAAKQQALQAFAGSEGVQSSDEARQQGGGKAMTSKDKVDEKAAVRSQELQDAAQAEAGELDPDDWGN